MKRITTLAIRGAVLAASLLVVLGVSQTAFAAREAADEVGRWVGFAAQAGQDLRPPNPCLLDIMTPGTSRPGSLAGTLSLVPAVRDEAGAPLTLNFTGFVTPSGRLTLFLRGGGAVGFCDGSVRKIESFGQPGGQDDIGELNYRVRDASGRIFRGHVNMIHLYGGLLWAEMVVPSLGRGGAGSCLPAVQDELAPASCIIGGSVDPELNPGQEGSQVVGSLVLGDPQTNDGQLFQMVGTINERGSLLMLGVFVKPPSPNRPALIGLLFTGAMGTFAAGPPNVLGRYGTADFGVLLPAIQRESVLSFVIGDVAL